MEGYQRTLYASERVTLHRSRFLVLLVLRRGRFPLPPILLFTQNPDHLLIFAAGNDGLLDKECSISSPAIGKNVLAVGASSSGAERLTVTGADGDINPVTSGFADIDTVAYFSSRGPTVDGRIKPEVLAPGDQVLHTKLGFIAECVQSRSNSMPRSFCTSVNP